KNKTQVTDGWYSVEASLDDALAHFLRRNKAATSTSGAKIAPGTKLAISNATLEPGCPSSSTAAAGGGTSGVDPLELLRRREGGHAPPGSWPRLRLSVNSTRCARWDAPLGFVRGSHRVGGGEGRAKRRGQEGSGGADGGVKSGLAPLEVPMCTLVPGGGLVTATRVIVLRRYPTLFVSGDFGGKGGDGSGGGGVAESSKARRRVLSEAEEE
ncbi:unnamed protein product, partial [Sphacelaria rigidula]